MTHYTKLALCLLLVALITLFSSCKIRRPSDFAPPHMVGVQYTFEYVSGGQVVRTYVIEEDLDFDPRPTKTQSSRVYMFTIGGSLMTQVVLPVENTILSRTPIYDSTAVGTECQDRYDPFYNGTL